MAGGQKNVMSETVVALSADIDNAGIQKLFSLLDTHRLKAYTLAASVAAVTTGVYKFMQSLVKEELELEKLAKKQNATIANTRAQQEALEAMGVTLNDIKKDAALKSMYDDLVKFNKGLELRNLESAMANAKKFRTELYKLKSAVSYAIKEVGAQVLTNLEMPIDRISGKMRDIAEWIRDNLHTIGMRVGSFITAFSKGVIGIGETVGKVFTWLKGMPDSIKGIAIAVGSLFLLFKTGPLGRILALVTAFGDLIHDYDVYKWNKANGGDVPVGLASIWDVVDNDKLSGDEKASQIATLIVGGLGDAMEGAFRDFSMEEVFEGSGDNPGLIQKVINWFDTNETLVKEVGTSFITFIARGVSAVGGTVGGVAGKIIDAIFGDGTIDPALYEGQGSAGATFAGTLGGFVNGVIGGIKKGGAFHEVFLSGLKEGFLGAIITALVSNIRIGENGEVLWQESFNGMFGDLQIIGKSLVNFLCKAISTVDSIGSMVFTAIAGAISGAIGSDGADQVLQPLANVFGILGQEDSIFGKAISEGIVAGFVSGNGIVGLITGLTRIVTEAIANPSQFTAEVQELANALGEFFAIIWEGDIDKATGKRKGGMLKDLLFGKDEDGKNTGWLSKLWEGEDGTGGLKGMFADIATQIGDWLTPVGDAIKAFFEQLWVSIFNNLPGWMKTIFGLKDPNTSTVSMGENGEVTVQSTTGNKLTYAKGGISSSAQAALNRFGQYFTLDENGNVAMSNGGDEMFVEGHNNRGQRRAISLQQALTYIVKNGIIPGEGDRESVQLIPNGYVNWDSFEDMFNNTYAKGGKPIAEIMPDVDISQIQQQIDTGKYHVNADVNLTGGKEPGKAWGGRIGSQGRYLVGEDGPEYIIPITKPERAFSLINQMLSEMGASAIQRVTEGLGIGTSGTVGASPASLGATLQGMTMANTYNISAPVNINVNATGADGKEIGSRVYDMAERHLIQSVMGVAG